MLRILARSIDQKCIVKKYFLVLKITICFIIISLSFFSCVPPSEEEIEWGVKSHRVMLVVDGAVTNEYRKQGIRLTLSNTYFSKDNPLPYHGAFIRISEGNNSYLFTESSDNSGWYWSNTAFAGIPGKTYNMHIALKEEINGKREYTSSSKMPEGLDIDSIRCDIYALPKEYIEGDNKIKDTTILVIDYFGLEPAEPGNYYTAKIYRNNNPLFSNVKSYPFTDDSERNGAYINIMAIIRNVAAKDTITFNLLSINKEYYNYIDAINKIDQTGDIYSPSGPPANAVGNINGALGFFIATYISIGKSIAIDRR